MIPDANSVTPQFIAAEMARSKPYYLLVYTMGPADRSDEETVDAVRRQHVAQLFAYRQQGTVVMHGVVDWEMVMHDSAFMERVGVVGAVRGIVIFNASQDEAEHFVSIDPMVRAGYLSAVIVPFIGLPGDSLP